MTSQQDPASSGSNPADTDENPLDDVEDRDWDDDSWKDRVTLTVLAPVFEDERAEAAAIECEQQAAAEAALDEEAVREFVVTEVARLRRDARVAR